MINNVYSFDAEQLELAGLGKLDKDQITWITIKGNHIPIPKGGSREQKAEAIKTWFANKKKELPQAKGRMSFYSAKVEHEAPKKTARGSGEGAQVHGEGQYTLKYAKNNYENYFKKFGLTKTLSESLSPEEKRKLHGWGSVLFTGLNSIDYANKKMETEAKIVKSDIGMYERERERYANLGRMTAEEIKSLLDNPEEMKKLQIPNNLTDHNDFWRWVNGQESYYRDKIKNRKEYLEKTESAINTLKRYIDEGKVWEESGIYTMGGKIFSRGNSKKYTVAGGQYLLINSLYRKTPEQRREELKSQINDVQEKIDAYKDGLKELEKTGPAGNWNYRWDKRRYEDGIALYEKHKKFLESVDPDDIKPAQAQMSKVELPASKTYLREATSLRGQSPYVKNNIKQTIIDAYNVNQLRDYGLNDIADEVESIIDDALGINNVHSSGSHIEAMLDNVKDKIKYDFQETGFYPSVNAEKNEKLEKSKVLVDKIADNIAVTLLAKNDKGELVINNGRGLYNKLGRILANAKSKSYWGASERQGQLEATKILSKHNISGIAYTGHGRSRVSGYTDSEGNVTFDPSTIKVLERTTDPSVIQQWIEEQEQHGQKERV